MSNIYTIQEETLTALGDAVRAKVGLTKVVYSEEKTIDFNWVHPNGKESNGSSAVYGVGTDWVFSEPGFTKLKIKANITTNSGGKLRIRPFYKDGYGTEFTTWDAYGGKEGETVIDGFTGYVKLMFQSGAYTSFIEGTITVSLYDADGNILACIPVEVLNTMTPGQMAEEMHNMIDPPNGAELLITGDCGYRFAKNGWNWFINKYKDIIAVSDITNMSQMFYQSGELVDIPFAINFYGDSIETFSGCKKLENIGDFVDCTFKQTRDMFTDCYMLRHLPNMINFKVEPSSNYCRTMFSGCYSLREIPEEFMKAFNTGTWSGYLGHPLNNTFNMCNVLDEVKGLPIGTGSTTSNIFRNTFYHCARLKNAIFMTQEDGTPYTAKWSSQTIDLSSNVGYFNDASWVTKYNTGITADKKVTDDATYQALKNDPDWYTENIAYSRYNHDSAVATINSLPDTSATSNGTNIIKFKGESGSATDGGAINTLTEEEIAVATAKGWTVQLV
jgi:hypothetical protein